MPTKERTKKLLTHFAFVCLLLTLISVSHLPQTASSKSGGGGDHGWTGSGGELFEFDKNPWFVRNTDTVFYCPIHDQASTTATTEVFKKAFGQALTFWQIEFARSQTGNPSAGFAKIGDQKWVEDCSKADLEIKFGHGTLNEDEIKFLKIPQKYVGITVRKQYDFISLKGKGIIYISSDKGPHAYENKDGRLISEAWQSEKLLQYALQHELGHVFGVSHMGTGLMSETFLDQLLSKRMASFFDKEPILPFLFPASEIEVCAGLAEAGDFKHAFFNADPSAKCMKLTLDANSTQSSTLIWKVSIKKTTEGEYEQIGQMRATTPTARQFAMKPAVLVQLPSEQKVFEIKEHPFSSFMIGPLFQETSYEGFYTQTGNPRPHPVFIDLKPDAITVTGSLNNGLKPVFIYTSPTLRRLIIPINP